MFCHSLPSSFQLLLFKKSILKPKDGKDEKLLEQPPDTLNLEIYHYVSKPLLYQSQHFIPVWGLVLPFESSWCIVTRMSLYIVVMMSVHKVPEYSYIDLNSHLVLSGMYLPLWLNLHFVFVLVCWFAHEYWALKSHLPLMCMHLFSCTLAKPTHHRQKGHPKIQ